MTNKEKDILALFNELKSMFNELQNDCNKLLAENTDLKKDVDWFKKYTDALIEHKDMVCLPADLKNLRESNAALATENEELKKKVETLNGIITQAWFTDVEEKNKQIDYLLKKVDELTRPEPTEEELNSLFMDKQVIPDEQDMYLNPEKHTGGDKTKKDIEFEAEMLVKCVQDYADSLKNKSNFSGSVSSPGITGMNLKEDESNLKYFNATTGKWNNAELMKQDPEILALKDPEPKLKSLKQHNDSKLTNVFGVNSKNSGFACPICTSELIYTNPNLMLTSHPPKREVRCSNCKHIDYVY